MVYLTRSEFFCAAHKLANPAWSLTKNDEVFGHCANPNWHGHNYKLFVTIKGKPDPDTGFVLSLQDFKNVIKNVIIKKVDHRNLNLDVDFMHGILPSTENFAIAIWNELKPHFEATNAELHCVKLQETETFFASYYGK